ncbi:efflux RND transporter permease subunit [Luteolibacter flavescens]|uniref:Efflux RND transporter permease subunit n=1 Tax=Luteolibacter flavescens TaxID=1859460 RepID=A0ABT3FMH8_9BACT|nr:efflux RND transporter permease subunit [Luteolibacter flavescens]MCW1884777.1 efflux RND transporter permease subunit [Luteolibacter flavescens]
MKGLIFFWARNKVAANFLMIALLVLGTFTWIRLKKEIFPEISSNFITVQTPYPNATPEEVEKGVCVPVEEAIQDLDGIERLTSTSAEGRGVVVVEVAAGKDVRKVLNDVKSRVDAIQNFAESVEKPIIADVLIRQQVMSLAVTADTDERTLRAIADKVRDDLLVYAGKEPTTAWEKLKRTVGNAVLGEPKITQIELTGVRDHEISIEVSETTLREYGMTFEQVANAVRSTSIDLPGGSVRTSAGEILIRAQNRRYEAAEIEQITVLTRPDGSVVKLSDVAKVIDGFKEEDLYSRYDGHPAIVLNIFRTGDEDTLRVAQLVKDFVAEESIHVPKGVDLEIWNDESVLLEGRIKLLLGDGFQGFVLVYIALALFLRPALAFHVALGIPIAFAGALMALPYGDISINMISLFAFILVLGIVTDDAIVVGERVNERIEQGEPAHLAAPRGTWEVMSVAAFGVFTTMIAFMPMFAVQGVSGNIWRQIPWIVIPVLIVSLIETNLILPSHLAHLKPVDPNHPNRFLRLQRKIAKGLDHFVVHIYGPLLERLIHWRHATVAAFAAVLMIVLGLLASGRLIKFEFFPRVEAEIVSAKLTLPNGVPVETTEAAIRKIEEAALAIQRDIQDEHGRPIIKHLLSSVGSQPYTPGLSLQAARGVNVGEVTIELQGADSRNRPDLLADAIIADWRKRVGPIPGAVELSFQLQTSAGGNAIDLELTGPDMDELDEAAEFMKARLATQDGIIDIGDSNLDGKREVKLAVTDAGEALGLRLETIARQVRQAFYGEEVQRLQRGRDEVRVYVRYPYDERRSLQNLSDMRIRTADGTEIPFTEVAEAEEGRGYAMIRRANRFRSINVTADIDRTNPNANANEVVEWMRADVFPEMKQKFPSVMWGFQGEQKDQRESVGDLSKGFVLALFGIYMVLALPLRSYVQPLIVMCVIPFGMIGAVGGHILFGMNFSVMSIIGVIALAGVVINESLVLVEFMNRYRREGHTVREAVAMGGRARFTPIFLTSITSFIGLLPMITETSVQAKFLIPMAVSLAFGGLINLFNTMLLVPCVYALFEDFRNRIYTPEALKRHEEELVLDANEHAIGREG